jgi:hypothetical protein
MVYDRICNKRKTTGATGGAGPAYLSIALEFTLDPSYNFFCDINMTIFIIKVTFV